MAVPPFTRLYFSFSVAVGNHAPINRFTYTVPAGKRARITYAKAGLVELIATAPTAAYTLLDINGLQLCTVDTMNNVHEDREIALDIPMNAGDTLIGQTSNTVAAVLVFRAFVSIEEYQ